MNRWPSVKANKIYKALLKIGWSVKRHRGTSHIILEKLGMPNYVWAFRDGEEIGSKMLARISKHTGLKLEDL